MSIQKNLSLPSLPEKPSKEEVLSRIYKLCQKMEENNIDFTILFQNVDLYYFTGTAQKGVLVITKKGDYYFFVKKSVVRAKEESLIDFIEEKNDDKIINFIIKNGLTGVCGLELDILPTYLYLKLSKDLKIKNVVDVSPIIKQIRMVKSEYELKQIKRSGEILDKVFLKAKSNIKEGMAEIYLASELESTQRKAGHAGIIRMRGFNQEMDNITISHGISATVLSYADAPILGAGLYPAVPHGASLKKIEPDIPILIDVGACFNGYIADETRPFVIGELKDDFKKPYECALEIINFIQKNGKEGVNSSHLFKSAYEIVKKFQLEEYFMGYGEGKVSFLGHGLGLEINEFPVITEKHQFILKEGMVFAVEPKFILPDNGAIGIEVDFIVRKNSLERITSYPCEITKI